MSRYSSTNLPGSPKAWPEWRKKVTTRAIKIDDRFEVETKEGVLSCPDGYLAVDGAGFPYPIATEDFEAMYESIGG